MKGNPMLAQWERDILDAIGRSVASVVFTLADGSTVEFDDVLVDSIGPSAENRGVIGVEFENDIDRIVHVPFVRYWEIEYR
jgi:hypothetical protein